MHIYLNEIDCAVHSHDGMLIIVSLIHKRFVEALKALKVSPQHVTCFYMHVHELHYTVNREHILCRITLK